VRGVRKVDNGVDGRTGRHTGVCAVFHRAQEGGRAMNSEATRDEPMKTREEWKAEEDAESLERCRNAAREWM